MARLQETERTSVLERFLVQKYPQISAAGSSFTEKRRVYSELDFYTGASFYTL